ncbi:hypothetical protein J437_LFUL008446 [Ladona fulva]|uniref:GPI inositol-deacylase n=1 Tax=Ladona fulva TaxID=123851 RepID=A0A8K0K7W4_LADFU|nr:hypothetical protein J437_LFUL008446 [Ladona fulva]
MLTMAAVNLFVILSAVLFLGFLLGTVDYLVNHEENKCEMTYMFEYPQYVRIVLPSEVAQSYPRYNLYAYGEGKYTEKLRGMEFGGIPVLFIPGNSGSYKQVRSLASVSLRKSLALNSIIQFDYFTADLNEEYSALYGPALREQTKFIHQCIESVLNLYSGAKKKPTSVILIGHSMGGLVAKGLLLEPGFDPKTINTIITLATPHRSPVLMVDEYMAQYYANVTRFWTNNRNSTLKHIPLASIGGGHRDVLVRSELIKTTAIPGVWVSTDHLSILWCKQLVLTVVRALFDMVDPKAMQITESIQRKNDSLSYHLMKRTAGKRLMEAFHPKEAHFSEHGDWQEPLKRQYSFHKERVLKTTYIMVRLTDNPKYHMLAIEAVNLEAKDWGVNLSNETKFLPSVRMKRKGILLNVAALRRMSYSHVIVQIPPLNEPLPVLEASTEGALRYEIRLQGADLLWQAYLLHLRPSCPLVSTHHATATMTTSWSHEDVHAFVTEKRVQPLHLKLQSPKPSKYGKNETMKIKIILDPACRYSVSIQSSLSDSLGQMVRFYASMLLPYMVAVLILAVRQQMKFMENEGYCSSVHTALAVGAKPYYILPTVKIASKLIGRSNRVGRR